MSYDDEDFAEPLGPEYVSPGSGACPGCPCHTRRVCEDALWHRAARPAYQNGRPYREPCSCEQAHAAANPPLDLTLEVTLGGRTGMVGAQRHRHGHGTGLLMTDRAFAARHRGGWVPVVLVLEHEAAPDAPDAPADQVATDSTGRRWALRTSACHGADQVTASAWWSEEMADAGTRAT